MPTQLIDLAQIRTDGGTQMRATIDQGTLGDYIYLFDQHAGAWPPAMPPIDLYYDGETYWLADGFHRVAAARQSNKLAAIPANITPGTRRDAILHAAAANATHGLRRTNADKRRAVETLLRDQEWSRWSDGEIARRCQVSVTFVGTVRRETTINGLESPSTRTGADGRTINVSNIGKSPAPTPPTQPPPTAVGAIPNRTSDPTPPAAPPPEPVAAPPATTPPPAPESDERTNELMRIYAYLRLAGEKLERFAVLTGKHTLILAPRRELSAIMTTIDAELSALKPA